MSKVRSFGTENQLLFDDALVEDKLGFTLTLNPPVKAETVALTPERPWEAGGVHLASVVEGGDGIHRMYYGATGEDGVRSLCYATSSDGVVWERPSLGIEDSGGSRDNNLVMKGVWGEGKEREGESGGRERGGVGGSGRCEKETERNKGDQVGQRRIFVTD